MTCSPYPILPIAPCHPQHALITTYGQNLKLSHSSSQGPCHRETPLMRSRRASLCRKKKTHCPQHLLGWRDRGCGRKQSQRCVTSTSPEAYICFILHNYRTAAGPKPFREFSILQGITSDLGGMMGEQSPNLSKKTEEKQIIQSQTDHWRQTISAICLVSTSVIMCKEPNCKCETIHLTESSKQFHGRNEHLACRRGKSNIRKFKSQS